MQHQSNQTQAAGPLPAHRALYTDLYELTMAQGYFLSGRKDEPAVFDYFFRKNPFDGGFVVFAGLGDLLSLLQGLSFGQDDLAYLRAQGFKPEFLEYLEGFEFSADIWATREGEIVFPLAPVLRVEGSIIEAQIVETVILNYLNFQSLVATKAARIRLAAGDRTVLDFGLRRAQGLGGIHASRAAVIGGADATSNVYAGLQYGLDISGTQAHAWIQSFDDELEAFRKYAEFYPGNCILLVDTYDTLRSGVPNAIQVGKEMEAKGHNLKGIRLDSGDQAYLSKEARQRLDEAELGYVRIFASNQLDEHLIRSLIHQGAPIDGFGIGTRLVTGKPSAALDGVYKLSSSGGQPRLKISENIGKISFPGTKKVLRLLNEADQFIGDAIVLEEEQEVDRIYHPHQPEKNTDIRLCKKELLLHPVMKNGEKQIEGLLPAEINRFARQRLNQLPEEHKRFEYPHLYKVGISEKLMNLRDEIVEDLKRRF